MTAETGLLLVNLGSPDAPEPAALRRYLRQFLSDRRVVDLPPLLWQPILNLAILPTRPSRSAAAYRRIWTTDSPLRLITAAQTQAMAQAFPDIRVDFAMRYGNPSIADAVDRMCAAGVSRLVFAPLYPQYSAATTGSVMAEIFKVVARRRHMPAINIVPPYWRHPAYIAALATSLQQSLAKLPFQPDRILLSFHGMPERTAELGDPYAGHCRETAQLLRSATGHDETTMPLTFQSRFGPARWLQPYTATTLVALARSGIGRVAVMMPGFAADCLETLDEIANEGRHQFLAAGGLDFAAIPCLNDSRCGIELLQSIIAPALEGTRRPV